MGRNISRTRTALLPVVGLIILGILWELSPTIFDVPEFILPGPVETFQKSLFQAEVLWQHTLVTLWESVAGFAIAAVVGVILSVIMVASKTLKDTLYPLMVVAQSVPKVAFAPVILLLFGTGIVSKMVIVFLICFFPVVISSVSGLESARPELLDLARSMQARHVDIYRKIRFPSALPSIFVGLKLAATLSVIGAVIGEFVGADKGLGYFILISTSQAQTEVAFGAIVVLGLMSLVLFYTVVLVEHLVAPWNRARTSSVEKESDVRHEAAKVGAVP